MDSEYSHTSTLSLKTHKTLHAPWKWPWNPISFSNWVDGHMVTFTWLVCTGRLSHNPCSCQQVWADTHSSLLPPSGMTHITGCILCAPSVIHKGAHHSKKAAQPVTRNHSIKFSWVALCQCLYNRIYRYIYPSYKQVITILYIPLVFFIIQLQFWF